MSETPVRLTPKPYLTESGVGTAPPSPAPPADGAPTEINLEIDGHSITARPGQLIIDAADEAGIYIPRFCYHPRMKPVGMCRMCLVEVVGPRGPSLMPACYNTVSEGMHVQTASAMAKKAQEGVLELLLVNHPLDCPVCDKGGECPLQDQTLAYGPGESRFVEEKRHWEKPIPISDLVFLDRERCIQCGRCVRFADEVAGDALIDFAERGDLTEVATFPGEPYSSYFSGNVVQICPVGALTAKPYRFKARPWDLEQVESTCSTCSVGCRVAVQSSAGEMSRLIGVDSDPVNWGWLCDKGRFAFAAGASPERVTVPLVRQGDELVEASWAEALDAAAAGLSAAKNMTGGAGIAVIGGSRLANEDAYAWAKAARLALGTDNVDAQLGDGIPATTLLGLPRATIDEAAAAPLVITVGADIKEELPVLYLRLRHAIRETGTQLVELTPARTGLSKYAAETLLYRPGEVAALASAIAGSDPVKTELAGVSAAAIASARGHIALAKDKGTAGAPAVVVIVGRASMAEPDHQVAAAALELAALPSVAFLSGLRRANVHGALDMGLAPGVLPGRVGLDEGRAWFEYQWGAPLPASAGLSTQDAFHAASRGRIAALVLLGADPRTDFPDAQLALRAMHGARLVVAVDTHLTPSSRAAHVVLPAAGWAERRGTFTNLEGRISWLSQLVTARGMSWPDWMIASELASRLGVDLGFAGLEDIWDEIARVSPLHHGVSYAELGGTRARDGVVVPASGARARSPKPLDPMADPGIASAELHRASPTSLLFSAAAAAVQGNGAPAPVAPAGDDAPPAMPPMLGLPAAIPSTSSAEASGNLRLVARRKLWDGGTLIQSVPSLAGLHPEATVTVHPSVLSDLGVAAGEKVRLTSERASVVLPVIADFASAPGSAVVAWNIPGNQAGDLIDSSTPWTDVQLEVGDHGG